MPFLRRLAVLVALALSAVVPVSANAIETLARQAILIDLTTGAILFDKNADELMGPSSMSKIMTVYLVFERLKEGRLSLDDTLPVSEKAWRKGGSKMFVEVGEQVSIRALLRGIIVQSGNDASIVVAEGLAGSEEAFAQEMTRKARELGLASSTFRNATGWPDPEHRMTARDLAVLATHIIRTFPEYYPIYSEREFEYAGIKQANRNPLLGNVEGVDGLKTGHTEEAGYGLTASADRDGRRLVLVVNGLPSIKARGEESAKLLEWGFREFRNVALFAPGEIVAEVDSWLGSPSKVPVMLADGLTVTLPRAARDSLRVSVVYDRPLTAPIATGETVTARLRVEAEGVQPYEIPLQASAPVDQLGFLGRIAAALWYLGTKVIN